MAEVEQPYDNEAFWLYKAHQIDERHWLRYTVDKEGRTIGAIFIHRDQNNELCIGSIHFNVPGIEKYGEGPRWDVLNWDPITLSPSIHCLNDGEHGFIREGRWVPA